MIPKGDRAGVREMYRKIRPLMAAHRIWDYDLVRDLDEPYRYHTLAWRKHPSEHRYSLPLPETGMDEQFLNALAVTLKVTC